MFKVFSALVFVSWFLVTKGAVMRSDIVFIRSLGGFLAGWWVLSVREAS